MNTALMLQVADAIEAHPERFDLGVWFHAPTKSYGDAKTGWWFEQLEGQCDTAACIAGWVNALTRGVNAADVVRATVLLGLPVSEETGLRLFHAGSGSIWAEVADEYGWTVIPTRGVNDWTTIKAWQAADVLRRIARGELTL